MTDPQSYLLIDEVQEDLKKMGFLPPGGGLYKGQEEREDEQVEKLIKSSGFGLEKVEERVAKLEGVFWGKTASLVGTRSAGNPQNRRSTSGNYGRHITSQGHVWKFKRWNDFNDVKSGGAGIFLNPWDQQGFEIAGRGNQITAYMGAVLNDGLDAGTPGIASLKSLAEFYRDSYEVERYAELRKELFRMGQGTRARSDVASGTHAGQDGGGEAGGWFTKYSKAFADLKAYATALGFFSPQCIEDKIPALVAALPKGLARAIIERDKRLQDDAVLRALTGDQPTPRPPPVKNLSPFDFQCFLIENIVHLSGLRAPGSPGAPQYKHVCRLKTGNDPGTLLSRINHGGQTHQIRQLMDLCPEAYALLEPSVKIYRVDYAKDNPTKPIREQELRIPNFIDKSDIDNMLKPSATSRKSGRPNGYGLKSFNWSLAGVQPAEVDNNITANMKFYFQSVQDLFQGQRAAGQKETSPLDLIISSRASEIVRSNKTNKSITSKPTNCGMLRNNINEEYSGANFRISARIGWNMPPKFTTAFPSFSEKVPGTKKTKGALLAQAIRNTQMHLFLQQTRHLIDFKEDGSVELDIQYQAALGGILKEERANILANDKTFFQDEIAGYRKQIEEEQNKDLNFALGGGDSSTGEGANTAAVDRDARVEDLLAEIQSLEIQDRNFKYKKFLQKLYTKNKIYNIAVPPAELMIPPWKDLTPSQRAARAKRRLSPNPTERGYKQVANNDFDASLLAAVTETSKDPTKEESELEKQAVNNAERFKEFTLNDETIMVPYFYLGDLIDMVLETLPGYDDGQKFLFYLSEVELLNPLLAFQVKNLAEVLCTDKLDDAKFLAALRNSDPLRFKNITKLQELINIGDIPISLDAFNVWFKDNVIKKDRDNYYFLYFVKDVCGQLISNALRGDCFGNSLKFDIRFDAAKIEVKKNNSIGPGKKATASILANRKAALSGTPTSIRNVLPALIIYSTDSKPKSRKGKFWEDLKVGIYHHYVGSACSIVKSINFQREDQPYLREAKIQKQGALDATQLRELYSVNLELIGNTLYKNGQYIYVDPTMVMADPALTRLLGISGYYLVTSVDHTISDAGYDVKIRALQEGIDFDENSSPTAVEFMRGEADDVPTWTPPEWTEDELDMAAGDAADAAVDAATEVFSTTWENIKENYAGDIETLMDDDLNWADARALLAAATPYNIAEAEWRGLQSGWNQWKENRALQGHSEGGDREQLESAMEATPQD